jgi:TPR repeat protein
MATGQQGNGHTAAAAASRTPEQQPAQAANGRPPQSCPLSLVVTDALRRWYSDAHRDALKGDVKQQALLGQMLLEGYGCDRDPAAGREWVDKAKRRGYRMEGVYCEL